jgi:hypothetical protein
MDTETVANLVWKHWTLEMSERPNLSLNLPTTITIYKSSFVYCLALTLSPSDWRAGRESFAITYRTLRSLPQRRWIKRIRACKHVACICTQVYAFESSVVEHVRIRIRRWRKPWCTPIAKSYGTRYPYQLVNNVRALYAQGTMTVFNAEPTVIVYHKTGKGSDRLIDDYPLQLNVCGLRCGMDCRNAGKELDDMLLGCRFHRRDYRMPLVVVYSHDRYRCWQNCLNIVSARPEKSDDGFILRFEEPMQVRSTSQRQ